MRKQIKLLFVMFFLVCGLLTVDCGLSNAVVPHLINYQGRLTDSGGTPLNGAYDITFRIYDAETAGSMLWEETHLGAVIQKGIFSVLLGSVVNLNLAFDIPYFLEIKVGAEVMSPRQRITSAGYAIRAEHGVPKGVIVMWFGNVSSIPSGWALCDGTNGTPDLRDKFVVGARQDDGGQAMTSLAGGLTKSGGSTSILISNLPSHNHGLSVASAVSAGAHIHAVAAGGNPTGNFAIAAYANEYPYNTDSAGAHTHALSGNTDSTGSGTAYTQPYYALAYIMKL